MDPIVKYGGGSIKVYVCLEGRDGWRSWDWEKIIIFKILSGLCISGKDHLSSRKASKTLF